MRLIEQWVRKMFGEAVRNQSGKPDSLSTDTGVFLLSGCHETCSII